MLGKEDITYLDSTGLNWETVKELGKMWVIIRDWIVPDGYTISNVNVALRIESNYPDTQIDMAYFNPALTLKNGKIINAASVQEKIDGNMWQRWSRHRTSQNPWQLGVDNIETHMVQVSHWIKRET
ncbi:MAG: hypothetical protein NT118_05765 [Lentisphaerae bacterium]|nr:hypothetical protein [Lentisphaerota bacterium]